MGKLLLSAGINSLTSSTLVDFYRRFWPTADHSESHQLRLARRITIGYGAIVIVFAFLVQFLGSLLEVSNSVIGLVGGPLLGLFLLGILVRRATAQGALIGWLVGVLALVPICFLTKVSFLWYAMIGCLVTMLAGTLVSYLDSPPDPTQLQGLTWGSAPPQDEQDITT